MLIPLRTQLYLGHDAVISAAASPPVEMHPQCALPIQGSSVTG